MTVSIQEARRVYEQAQHNEELTVVFLQRLDREENNTLTAYKGALLIVMSKHYFSPFKKLESFNQGKAILEKAIEKEPASLELRYLRYTIQCHLPSFLSYNQDLNADRELLFKGVSGLTDKDLRMRIARFLLTRSDINEQQKKALQEII